MIGWLLDTNVSEEINRAGGASKVRAWAKTQPEARIFYSILTFGEYTKGINMLADDDARRERFAGSRDDLYRRFAVRTLPISAEIVYRWGAISGAVKRNTGHPPPVIDTLLAATAIEHDLYLVTRNVRDVKHSGAAVFNPWLDDPADFPIAAA